MRGCKNYSASPRFSAERQPLRAYLTHGFLLVATVPLLLLNIVNGQAYAKRQQMDASQRLDEAASAIRQHMEEFVSAINWRCSCSPAASPMKGISIRRRWTVAGTNATRLSGLPDP